jgi:homoserine dehydrogenase
LSKKEKMGVDLVGFGPIGRDLARKLVAENRFFVASISDSSGTIYPEKRADVLSAIRWKEASRSNKLMSSDEIKKGAAGQTNDGLEQSNATIAVDLTDSDYKKKSDAKNRALFALRAGKNFVSANKVGLANYFHEILDYARKKDLFVGYGATICGARHALRIAKSIDEGEIESARAVLNTSTTFVLSILEENPDQSISQACNEADKTGILERDWSVDLDGIDAAAKTAILSNVLFPKERKSIDRVQRRGIRDSRFLALRDKAQKSSKKIRLVSEIVPGRASVAPRVLEKDSPLCVNGRFNAVAFETKSFGEISVKSFGGGVSLTSSIVLSDLKEAWATRY